MEQYKKIFIREEAGRKLLSGMFPEKEIETMIDPTLMLEKRQWEEIIEKQPVCKEAYIGCYATLEDELDQMMPLLRHLYQTYQKKVILFGMVAPREETWIENYVTAGPLEFILIIRDADFILTNSFHGTAFSLNFHTQFLTYHDGLENPRKEGLLHMVHLERRMVHTLEECRMICEEEIDFTEPERILQQERKQALYKIKEMLANGA